MINIFILLIFIFIFLRVPLFVTTALSSIIYMIISGQSFLLVTAAPRIFAGMNMFTMIAMPLFILCGDLMSEGKISDTLSNLAKSLVGWLKGSLAITTVLSCMFFGAVSGSGVATASAIGSIIAPQIDKQGYDRNFITAIIAASGPLGLLIPPSGAMVLFGAVTGTSVASLLIGGIGPGILFGVLLMVYCYIYSYNKDYGAVEKFRIANVGIQLKNAFWALLSPVIILGGIYSGIFTPTEAAVVAVVYSFLVGVFIFKTINKKTLFELLLKSTITSSTIMIITGCITLFNWVLARERVPQLLTATITRYISTPIQFMFFTLFVFLIAGMFIDIPAAILLLTPLFMPLVRQFGLDPVYFGVFMVSILAIGMITPPVALSLYVSAMVTNTKVNELIPYTIPLVVALVIGALMLIYFPGIIMLIPRSFMG